MTHSEIRKVFEKKMNEAVASIKSAKNGDKLSINTSLSYIDDNLVGKSEYNGRSNTSLVVSCEIFAKGYESEEDPAYEISLLCDLKNGEAKNPTDFVKELENFDTELARFLGELSSADDVRELIRKEDERITNVGVKMVANMEASLKKMKKVGIIGAIILVALLIAFNLAK